MDKLALGRRIHTARREQGLTSERLAEQCHINATYLRQIESGSKTPSLPMFVTLCQQLRVSPHYLLSDELAGYCSEGLEILIRLLDEATPRQLELICVMIRSALETLDEK